MKKPNFKDCPYFAPGLGGICRMAKVIPELKLFESSIQCCYMMPVPTYDCPNPAINLDLQSEETQFEEEKDILELEYPDKDDNSLLPKEENFNIFLQSLDDVYLKIDKDIEALRLDLQAKVDTLEKRIVKLESGIKFSNPDQNNKALVLPNGDFFRPAPIIRKSQQAKKQITQESEQQAEKELQECILDTNINPDLLNQNFFTDYNISEQADRLVDE